MKIACFREFSDPESTLFKNIINFSVDLFSFLNPPTVVPPTFSHFSPTHPFFFIFPPCFPRFSFLAPLFSLLWKRYTSSQSQFLSFSRVGRHWWTGYSRHSHIRIHCVSSATFYLVRYWPSTSFIVTFSFLIFIRPNVPIKSYCMLRAVLSRYLTFAKT